MKKKLLKPPQNDGQILSLPHSREFVSQLKEGHIVGTAHQPYFFNPGVSLKFIFLDNLPKGKKRIIFVDTDKIKLEVKVPSKQGINTISLINSEEVLSEYLTPQENIFTEFLSILESNIKEGLSGDFHQVMSNFSIFREILLGNTKRKFLKEVLGESFLQFYGLKPDYLFLSNLVKGKEFGDFFLRIYKEDNLFRSIFNQSLDDYRKDYRFRYKNFPFPKLQEGELPFWIVEGPRRLKCFKKDIDLANLNKLTILPRASTLTIFLRRYKLDFFIHGVGGANYESVQDEIIERFFKERPSSYAVISGTFLLDDFKERGFPYFFFSPRRLQEKVGILIKECTDNPEMTL